MAPYPDLMTEDRNRGADLDALAPVPGNVIGIDAAVGDALAGDNPVITVESMKIQIPNPAPIGPSSSNLRRLPRFEGETSGKNAKIIKVWMGGRAV